jgi:hypothetical protein
MSPARRPQHGVSLIEVLLGLVMGLLAMGGALRIWHSLAQAQAEQRQRLVLDGQMRQLLDGMRLQFNMAGSAALSGAPEAPRIAVPDLAAVYAEGDRDAPELGLRYVPPWGASNAGCLWRRQEALAGLNDNLYGLSRDGQTLRCHANGLTQPLIDGLRQVQWDVAVVDAQRLRWQAADDLPPEDWPRVRAVRLCIHVQGGPQTAAPGPWRSCDGATLPSQGRFQTVHRRTMALRVAPP